MNRRDLLVAVIGATVVAPITANADCRDDNGMMNPDFDDFRCIELDIQSFRGIGGQGKLVETARAVFGFGAYESLMKHQREKKQYHFEMYGKQYRIVVTRLDIDVNRHIGCVVCEVHGKIYS